MVAGKLIWVPADVDDAALEIWRQAVEDEMNRATARAYEIAEGRAAPALWSEHDIAALISARDRSDASRQGSDSDSPEGPPSRAGAGNG